MSKSAKKWLIAAASLVLVGAIMFAAVMTVYHWDFSRLSTEHFETNTCEISEEFSDIKLNTETADILFSISDDNMVRLFGLFGLFDCSIVCPDAPRKNLREVHVTTYCDMS